MLLAAGRAMFGAGLLFAPKKAAHGWIGAAVDEPAPQMLVRAVGVRDLVIGAGGVLAIARGQTARGWIEAGAVADVADFAITVAYWGKLPKQGALMTMALTAVAGFAGVRLAPRVDGERAEAA